MPNLTFDEASKIRPGDQVRAADCWYTVLAVRSNGYLDVEGARGNIHGNISPSIFNEVKYIRKSITRNLPEWF